MPIAVALPVAQVDPAMNQVAYVDPTMHVLHVLQGQVKHLEEAMEETRTEMARLATVLERLEQLSLQGSPAAADAAPAEFAQTSHRRRNGGWCHAAAGGTWQAGDAWSSRRWNDDDAWADGNGPATAFGGTDNGGYSGDGADADATTSWRGAAQ